DTAVTHLLPGSGRVVIGRSTRADLRVNHDSLSRTHAAIHIGPPLELEDLDSANGTWLGKERLVPRQRVGLSPGAVFTLGKVLGVIHGAVAEKWARRIWKHDYFEARLEDQCAHAERSRECFAVVRLQVECARDEHQVQAAIGQALRTTDALA